MEFSMFEKNMCRCMKKLKGFKGFDFPERPERTAVSKLEETTRAGIVQCVLSPLKRI